MSEPKAAISPARLRAAPAYIAFLMLAIASFSFIDNDIFRGMIRYFGLALPVDRIFAGLAIVPAMLVLASLRRWSDRTIKVVVYLSMALYMPAVIGLSRIDLLKVAGYSFNFGAFSSGLPPAVITAFGILLASGGLLIQSFSCSKGARAGFLLRGADTGEVDHALYQHTMLEGKITFAAAAVALASIAGVTVLEPAILWVLQSARFSYVLVGPGAALILGLIILVYIKKKW